MDWLSTQFRFLPDPPTIALIFARRRPRVCPCRNIDIISPAIHKHHGVVGDAVIFPASAQGVRQAQEPNQATRSNVPARVIPGSFTIPSTPLLASILAESCVHRRRGACQPQRAQRRAGCRKYLEFRGHSFQLRDLPHRARFSFLEHLPRRLILYGFKQLRNRNIVLAPHRTFHGRLLSNTEHSKSSAIN